MGKHNLILFIFANFLKNQKWFIVIKFRYTWKILIKGKNMVFVFDLDDTICDTDKYSEKGSKLFCDSWRQ